MGCLEILILHNEQRDMGSAARTAGRRQSTARQILPQPSSRASNPRFHGSTAPRLEGSGAKSLPAVEHAYAAESRHHAAYAYAIAHGYHQNNWTLVGMMEAASPGTDRSGYLPHPCPSCLAKTLHVARERACHREVSALLHNFAVRCAAVQWVAAAQVAAGCART